MVTVSLPQLLFITRETLQKGEIRAVPVSEATQDAVRREARDALRFVQDCLAVASEFRLSLSREHLTRTEFEAISLRPPGWAEYFLCNEASPLQRSTTRRP